MEMFLRLREKYVVDAVLDAVKQWHNDKWEKMYPNSWERPPLQITLKDIEQLREWSAELMKLYDNKEYPLWFREPQQKIKGATYENPIQD